MATVLVVDDADLDREMAGGILSTQTDLKVSYASSGAEALAFLSEEPPTLIVSDLQMPGMSGLALVEEVRERQPDVPVIIMTAFGSEEIAADALRRGAASYVPKRNLARDLAPTVQSLRAVLAQEIERCAAEECVERVEYQYVIDGDVVRIPGVVASMRQAIVAMKLCDATQLTRVAVALNEALCNAIHHGNLEVDSSVREQDVGAYFDLIKERCSVEPYCSRRAHVSARLTRAEAVFVVRDEGNGFDPSTVPDPKDPANLMKLSGRGLMLIQNFMDEAHHNEDGTELTMILRRRGDTAAA